MNAKRKTIYRGMLRGALGLTLMLAGALSASPMLAEDVSIPAAIKVTATPTVIAGGAGTQTDPHISGNLVTYSHVDTGQIHYYDLSTGYDALIARPDGAADALSDVNGNTIVFMQNGTGDKRMMFSTVSNGVASSPQELAPLSDLTATPLRQRGAIGGTTVAFEDIIWPENSSSQPEISIADTSNPSALAVRLTYDGYADRYPAVSPDGKVIVWVKSVETGSDVYESTKNPDGTWTIPLQLTTLTYNESFPDTDGKLVVYGSYRGGENDIYFQQVGGGTETRLALPGYQQNPNISNGLIAFESDPNGVGIYDIYAYDTQTNTLYQITDTPTQSERLNDIWLGSDNVAHLVWAAPGSADGSLDIYSLSFQVQRGGPLYTTVPLFDQSRSYKLGSVVPIRFQLLDGQGANISSASLLPTATGLVQQDTAAESGVQDAGNSNPDSAFRYDSSLQGYVFNLSTRGLSLGTWKLEFTVPGDSLTYHISFSLK